MSSSEVSRKLPDVSISFNSLAGSDAVSSDHIAAEQAGKKSSDKPSFSDSVPEHTIHQPIPSVSISFGSSVNSLAAMADHPSSTMSPPSKLSSSDPVQQISKPIPDLALSFTLSADKLAELAASASTDGLKAHGSAANTQSAGGAVEARGLEPTAEGDENENDSVSGESIDVGIEEAPQTQNVAKEHGDAYRVAAEEKGLEKDADGFIEIQLENVNDTQSQQPSLSATAPARPSLVISNSSPEVPAAEKAESNVSVTRQTISDQIEYDQDGFPIIKPSQQRATPAENRVENPAEEIAVDPSSLPLTSFKRDAEEPDEFDAVWKQLEQPARKMLKPSKKQVEAEHKPEPAPSAPPAPQPSSDSKPADSGKGIQTGVLEKLNLKPTNILDAYKADSEPVAAQPASSEAVNDPLKAVAKDEPKEASEAKEWEQITELRQKQLAEKGPEDGKAVAAKPSSPALNYDAALKFLMGQNLEEYKNRIVVKDLRKQGCFANLMSCVTGGPSLPADLAKERDAVFSFALMTIEETVPEHERMLQTLYKTVTGDKLDCPRFGKHWELLGFQGNDPATDLRGSGLLGLLQLLFLFKTHRALALRIHQLSKDDIQNFPFAVVSLNITGIVLQTLRETRLYDDIKKRNSVLESINELYAAAFYEFLVVWKREGKTVADFGAMKKRLAASVSGAPELLIAGFRKHNSEDVKKEKLEFSEIP